MPSYVRAGIRKCARIRALSDFDHLFRALRKHVRVSDACQINDFDHARASAPPTTWVSDACQINDFDHCGLPPSFGVFVSDACQINDFDHRRMVLSIALLSFRCLSDQ